MADAFERIRNRSAVIIKKFRLLQNRIRLAARKCIAGKNKQGDPVCRCTAARRYHICCAGADGGNAGYDGFSIHLLCISNNGKRHILLIFTLIKFQVMTALLQRLAHADHAAVAENAEDAGNELGFHAVTLNILIVKKAHKRLGHC